MSIFPRALQTAIVCLLVMGAFVFTLPNKALASGGRGNRFVTLEAEINKRHAQIAEKSPRDAALRYAWAEELDRLAVDMWRNKTASISHARQIQERACAQYALAVELEPSNQRYWYSYAMMSSTLVENTPVILKGMDAEPLLSAKKAFEGSDRLNSGIPKSHLRRCWAESLAWAAAKDGVPPEVALEMLAEADRVYAMLVLRSPEEQRGNLDNADYWEKRGEAAVTVACMSADADGCKRALGRAREYFLQAGELNGSLQGGKWVMALDPRGKSFRDPAFAEILLRERLSVLLQFIPPSEYGSRDWNLCSTFEEVAAYEPDAEAQKQMLRQARPYCAASLESPIPLYREGMKEAIDRIDARMADRKPTKR